MSVITFPSEEDIAQALQTTPDYMYPNEQPYGVMAPAYLSESQCREIQRMYEKVEPYKQEHCGASTRELQPPMRGPLAVVEDFVLGMNKLYWQYDLNPNAVAWLQRYNMGATYPLHTDTYYGQSRKLTAVVMLTDPKEYHGGLLLIKAYPNLLNPPIAQGSIVVFQSWHQHEVTEVIRGKRETINMGFWGPQFK